MYAIPIKSMINSHTYNIFTLIFINDTCTYIFHMSPYVHTYIHKYTHFKQLLNSLLHVYMDNHRVTLFHAKLAIFIFYIYLSAARMEWICIQNVTPLLSKFLYPFHYVFLFIRCKFNTRGIYLERLVKIKTIVI